MLTNMLESNNKSTNAAYIASVALYIYAVMGELNCLALLDDVCSEFLMSRGG